MQGASPPAGFALPLLQGILIPRSPGSEQGVGTGPTGAAWGGYGVCPGRWGGWGFSSLAPLLPGLYGLPGGPAQSRAQGGGVERALGWRVWLGPEDLARQVDRGWATARVPPEGGHTACGSGWEPATPPTPPASAPLPRGCCVGRRDPGAHPPGSAARTTARGCSSSRMTPTPRSIPVPASCSCGTGRTRSWCVTGLGDPRGPRGGLGGLGRCVAFGRVERLEAERGSGGPPREGTLWPGVVLALPLPPPPPPS